MRILAIIPAKLDSKRLKHKNIREIDGKPMFLHSVDYADASRYGVEVIVSSESDVVEEICNQHEVRFHKRPTECKNIGLPSISRMFLCFSLLESNFAGIIASTLITYLYSIYMLWSDLELSFHLYVV